MYLVSLKILHFKFNVFRLSQIGVVSYGSECPSHGVYARVTEVKHWIQFIAQGAEDTNCNQEIPVQQGDIEYEYSDRVKLLSCAAKFPAS